MHPLWTKARLRPGPLGSADREAMRETSPSRGQVTEGRQKAASVAADLSDLNKESRDVAGAAPTSTAAGTPGLPVLWPLGP